MASILCLAHYCDTHGPTPLMSTEGLPVGCISCFHDETLVARRPSSSARSLNPADGLAGIQYGGRTSSASEKDNENTDREVLRKHERSNSSAIETPPASPRIASLQYASGYMRESTFRKTYDENDRKRASPCDNCALTMPKKTKESTQGKIDANGPVLRTRIPYERIARALATEEQLSPPKSASSSDSESAVTSKPNRRTQSRSLGRAITSSSVSSFNSTHSHDHYLDFTSTHEPLAPSSFSLIRASCLRIFTCETLPPSSSQSVTSPTSPYMNSTFSSGPSSPALSSSSTSGPIVIGDSSAGYTTAYIFRIPDPNARGRRRVYALMALSTHRERVAMSAFSHLTKKFIELIEWIQMLAEEELKRAEAASESLYFNEREGSGGINGGNNTPTSSFLSGRNRGGDGKFASMSLRARGLADLVGMPDFFFELHAKFVRLLMELNMIVGA